MASRHHLLVAFMAISCFTVGSHGAVLFSSLPETLIVSASPLPGEVLKAGEDMLTVTWSVNGSSSGGLPPSSNKIGVKLCYAPVSQKDRSWRKTSDNLSKDKTCPFTITTAPYTASSGSSVTRVVAGIMVADDIPSATYFVRAYAFDSAGDQVAYGQTTNSGKKTNLFVIQGISGRHASLDIAASCFSAFSIVSLIGFFYLEKRKGQRSQKK